MLLKNAFLLTLAAGCLACGDPGDSEPGQGDGAAGAGRGAAGTGQTFGGSGGAGLGGSPSKSGIGGVGGLRPSTGGSSSGSGSSGGDGAAGATDGSGGSGQGGSSEGGGGPAMGGTPNSGGSSGGGAPPSTPGGGGAGADCGPQANQAGGSQGIAPVRTANFANIPLQNVVAGPSGYHIGVDLSLSGYVPGHHSNDPYYGANVMAHVGPLSYYKVVGPGQYPLGIFIDNSNPNFCTQCGAGQPCSAWCDDRCTPSFTHGWANRVTSAALEIYPHDDAYGGVRLTVGSFPNAANGGVYSSSLGTVTLPTQGAAGVAKLNGFVWNTKGGQAVGEGRLTVDIFHFGPARKTTTGIDTLSFGSTHTNKDGYYRFSALYYGNHKTYVTDNVTGKKKVVWLDLNSPDIRIDFFVDDPCFGMSSCENP